MLGAAAMDAIQSNTSRCSVGDPSDGRQGLGRVLCLRNHAVMTAAAVIKCDGQQLLCIVPCVRSHAVMDDRCSAGGPT